MDQFAKIILKHPKSFLGIFIVFALAAFYPVLQLETDFNLENFFPENDPTIEDYERLEEEFGRDDNTIIVGFKRDSIFTSSVLSDLKEITDSVADINHIKDVKSLWTATDMANSENRLTFNPYLKLSSLNQRNIRDARSDMLRDPFVKGLLINDKTNTTAFYLEIEEDKNSYLVRESILNELHQILEPYTQKYDFKISGIPHYRNQYINYLNEEILFYILLSSLFVIFILWILYRSLPGVLIPMLVVWMTIIFALAVMQLTGGYFEVMTSTIAPILLCVGIADSIHMISKYDDARLQGLNRDKSITEMLRTLGSATFLTSLTTAVGFGTLVTSNIIPMKRFGIYTAAGVLIAYIVTIFFVPSLLRIGNFGTIFKSYSARIFEFLTKNLERVSAFNKAHFKRVTIISLLFTLTLGSGTFFLKVNGKVFDELSEDTKPIRDARFFSENLSSPFPMEFIINTRNKNGITDPDFVRELRLFTQHLSSYPEVQRATSFHTLMEEVHQTMAPEQASLNPVPDSEQLLAQYLLLMEVSDTDFLKRVADFNYQQIRVAAQIEDVGSYRVSQIRDELDTYLHRKFPDCEIIITGSTILSADMNSKIVGSLFKSILLAFLIISVIMAFMFRNIRMVFISLVPNILPLFIVAGIMGFTGIDIKSSTAVIFTIAFGIAVDDSIHYLARLRIEMKRGRSLHEALRITTVKTGKAIIVTSLILLAGFGTLLTSVFSSTVYMGLLVCLTVFAALLADLLLLPSLLYWIDPDFRFIPKKKQPAPKSAGEELLEVS